jgi:hypothetical protein
VNEVGPRQRRKQDQREGEKGKIPVRRRNGEEQGDYESEITAGSEK